MLIKERYFNANFLNIENKSKILDGHDVFRDSHQRCSIEKDVLKNFLKFKERHLGLWRRCFPVNFAKFLRTPILQNTSGGCFCVLSANF